MTKAIIEQLENLESITLHISERGKRLNVRAYAGYNRTTKRSDYVLLGSLDKYTLEQNKRLQSVLERSERIRQAFEAELEKYKEVEAAAAAKGQREALKDSVIWRAECVADGLEARLEDEDDISAELAASVYAAIKRAEVVLRKYGHSKNPKPSK